MKTKKTSLYVGAWVAYLAASFFLFPYLRVTVFLLSIPLTMLGGWFYRYRGALTTTLLTIPYHAVLLGYYSDDLAVLLEAFNPLGISTQFFFSGWTALLKINLDRYRRLTDSLDQMVEEQTADLRLLTEYLMDLGDIEHNHVLKILLDTPNTELQHMYRTGSLLQKHLEETHHPSLSKAETVTNLVLTCMTNLQTLGKNPSPTMNSNFNIETAVKQLATRLQTVSGANIHIAAQSNWHVFDAKTAANIYHIIHEALTNALRHAEPSDIEIGLIGALQKSTLYIRNNGRKIPPSGDVGMGLFLMEQRAHRIGATLTFDSQPGLPTCVECVIPHPNAS